MNSNEYPLVRLTFPAPWDQSLSMNDPCEGFQNGTSYILVHIHEVICILCCREIFSKVSPTISKFLNRLITVRSQ